MIEYPGDEIEHLPKPGDVVAAGYTVVRTLGVGGMGVVLEVESEELGGRCALKIMLPSLTDDVEFKARFERESRISQLVDSEHVVRVLDVGSLPDGRLFMAMELLAGHDLATEIDARGALPISEAIGVVLQACDALHEAHKQGIVHRDLKPANLFLATRPGGDRIVKLLDFGISKKLESTMHRGDEPSLTATDSVLGSPKYMAPEQIRNAKGVDGRADIWSLGVILYRLLLDRHPYRGESLGEYVTVLAFEPAHPIDPDERSIPDALAATIMRCIEKKPESRYRTVARLAADLAPWAPPSVAHILERMRRDEPAAFPNAAPLRTIAIDAPPRSSGTIAERTLARPAVQPAARAVASPTTADATITDRASTDATIGATVSESGSGSSAASELRTALAGIRVSATEAAPRPPPRSRAPLVVALVVLLIGGAVAIFLALGR